MSPGADMRLERLRDQMIAARRRGETFDRAWTRARRAVTAGLPAPDRCVYATALSWSSDAWRAAYEGEPLSTPERAISELGSYALDGELERLSADA